MQTFETRPLALGLPLWGQADWKGGLYPAEASPRDFLAYYAQVMDAVEGNTTFYSLPPPAAVARWQDATPADFRFSFKFPRLITHDRQLRHVERETADFLARLAPLESRLGSYMLQLPPSFGPEALPDLGRLLRRLPRDYRYAVEVRHPGFFTLEGSEQLDGLLFAHGVERIVMDTRGMRAGDPGHSDVVTAAHEKPDLPVAMRALTEAPMVRFVAHPTAAVNAAFLTRWAQLLADWVVAGRRPTFFMHCPNNQHSPRLALWLDRLVRARVAMPPLVLPSAVEVGVLEPEALQMNLI